MTEELITRTEVEGSKATAIRVEAIRDAELDTVITQPSDYPEFGDGVEECYEIPSHMTWNNERVFVPTAFIVSPRKYVESMEGAPVEADDIERLARKYPDIPDEDSGL